MVQNFLQPKGSLNTKVDVSGLEQQLAKMFSAPQSETQPDPLRETVNEIVKTKLLNPVEVPKYTTLNDVLSANKGDKLGVFADFLDNPQTMRTIGTLLGGTYMDRRGNFVHGLEKQALERENLMKSEQEKALDEARQQNALAGNVYNAYKQMDIADMNDKRARELAEQELNFKKEQNELDRTLQREQMQNSLKIAGIVHSNRGGGGGGGSSSGGTVTGQAANIEPNISNVKFTAADRKALTENKTTLANIDAGLKSLEQNPKAYSFLKGVLGSDITNRIDPKGVATRTQIDNITAVYRKWLTGAQMSDKERKAYERFLPAPTDNYNIVKSKLEGMKGAVQRSNDALLSNYGISSTTNADPLGLGL